MSIYTIADLHLSFGTNKPMDDFYGWRGYVDKIRENWVNNIHYEDTVVIPGDFSWGMNFEEALPDFCFLNSLPGDKIILKGNHDYWWSTRSKMDKFIESNNLSTIRILHNNSFLVSNKAICGTRGWIFGAEGEDDVKVSAREALRLEASLKDSLRFGEGVERIVFLHYPPVFANELMPRFIDIMRKYEVLRCFYGHLHGNAKSLAVTGEYCGINFNLISSDSIDFCPQQVE